MSSNSAGTSDFSVDSSFFPSIAPMPATECATQKSTQYISQRIPEKIYITYNPNFFSTLWNSSRTLQRNCWHEDIYFSNNLTSLREFVLICTVNFFLYFILYTFYSLLFLLASCCLCVICVQKRLIKSSKSSDKWLSMRSSYKMMEWSKCAYIYSFLNLPANGQLQATKAARIRSADLRSMIAEIESVDLTVGLVLLPPLFLTLRLWYKIADQKQPLPIRGKKSGQKGRKKKEEETTSGLRREKCDSLAISSLSLISPYQFIWITTRHATSAISFVDVCPCQKDFHW